MPLQFYVSDLNYASVFQRILSPTGAPAPVFQLMITSYLAGSAGHGVKMFEIVSFLIVYYVFVNNC